VTKRAALIAALTALMRAPPCSTPVAATTAAAVLRRRPRPEADLRSTGA